jgi:uncharacterized membrane protein
MTMVMTRRLARGCTLRSISSAATLGAVVWTLSSAEARPDTTFTPLGDLPGGTFGSVARGISNDGTIVVGQSMIDGGFSAGFRWSAPTGMTPLAVPAGWPVADCLDISGDGSTLLGSGITSSKLKSHMAALYWTRDLDPISLDALFEPYSMLTGSTFDATRFIGADRVGWSHEPGFNSSYAFIYNAGDGVTYLPDLPGSQGFFDNCGPADIAANEQFIVGFGETTTTIDAVVWTNVAGQWQVQSLGHLPGGFGFSQAMAISAEGNHVSGIAATAIGYEPFMWTAQEAGGASAMISLGSSPHDDYRAGAVSAMRADGRVVIGSWAWGLLPSLETPGIAFMWSANRGMRDLQDVLVGDAGLNLDGWSLTAATDMTPDGGVIIGNAANPQGHQEAWMVRLDERALVSPDITSDGVVDAEDLVAVILAWGACPPLPMLCPADANNSGVVDADDLVAVILHWD